MKRILPGLFALCLGLVMPRSAPASPADSTLDSFEDLRGWSAHPAEGVEVRISPDSGFAGHSMRLDFPGPGCASAARQAITAKDRSRRRPDQGHRIDEDLDMLGLPEAEPLPESR